MAVGLSGTSKTVVQKDQEMQYGKTAQETGCSLLTAMLRPEHQLIVLNDVIMVDYKAMCCWAWVYAGH